MQTITNNAILLFSQNAFQEYSFYDPKINDLRDSLNIQSGTNSLELKAVSSPKKPNFRLDLNPEFTVNFVNEFDIFLLEFSELFGFIPPSNKEEFT